MSEEWRRAVASPSRLRVLARSELVDTPPEETFDRLTRLAARLLRAPVCLVSLVAAERQFFKSSVGLGEPWLSRRETPLSHSFCKHVVGSGERLVVADARESALLRENPAVEELGALAYAGVPLDVEGETVGAFCVIDHAPHAWTDDELQILNELGHAVAEQISMRLVVAELAARQRTLDTVLETMPAGVLVRDVAGAVTRTNGAAERILGRSADETDVLTGIPNRRAAEIELAKALALSDRAGTPLCVALFDIDHFKHVNDEFGHAAGDDVLRRVAAALVGAKRLTDTVARWGGEEFVAILPVQLEGALAFCERIRARVTEVECAGVGHVTVSAGVAERAPREQADALLRHADAGLYAAKARGRNRVEIGL